MVVVMVLIRKAERKGGGHQTECPASELADLFEGPPKMDNSYPGAFFEDYEDTLEPTVIRARKELPTTAS